MNGQQYFHRWEMKFSDLVRKLEDAEVWATVEAYPQYSVSSWGRVKRGKIITPVKTGDYWVVSLSDGGKTITARLHVLVINAFVGMAPFEGAMVAHNDGNTDNNRISNLRWASALENQADRARHNSRTIGSDVFGAKLDEKDIPGIRRRIALGERYPSIARDYGVSVSTISLIKLKRTWTHV